MKNIIIFILIVIICALFYFLFSGTFYNCGKVTCPKCQESEPLKSYLI